MEVVGSRGESSSLLDMLKRFFVLELEKLYTSGDRPEKVQFYFTVDYKEIEDFVQKLECIEFEETFYDNSNFDLTEIDAWFKERIQNGERSFSYKSRLSKSETYTIYKESTNESDILQTISQYFTIAGDNMDAILKQLNKTAQFKVKRYYIIKEKNMKLYFDAANFPNGAEYWLGSFRLENLNEVEVMPEKMKNFVEQNHYLKQLKNNIVKFPCRSKIIEYYFKYHGIVYDYLIHSGTVSTVDFASHYIKAEEVQSNLTKLDLSEYIDETNFERSLMKKHLKHFSLDYFKEIKNHQ